MAAVLPTDYKLNYPLVGLHFTVQVLNIPGIGGTNEGSFQEVSGLSYKSATTDMPEGGENRFIRKFPSPPKYDNLILKRGMLIGSPLIKWATDSVANFAFTPQTVVIKLMANAYSDKTASVSLTPITTWNIVRAYPIALKVSEFKAQEGAIVVETLELCYEYFTIVT